MDNNQISTEPLLAHSKIIDKILQEFYKLYGGFILVINLPYIDHYIRYYSYDNEIAIDRDEIFTNISSIIKNAQFQIDTTIWIKTPENQIIYLL